MCRSCRTQTPFNSTHFFNAPLTPGSHRRRQRRDVVHLRQSHASRRPPVQATPSTSPCGVCMRPGSRQPRKRSGTELTSFQRPCDSVASFTDSKLAPCSHRFAVEPQAIGVKLNGHSLKGTREKPVNFQNTCNFKIKDDALCYI